MAEVTGITKLFSSAPDAAELEREISKIRTAKENEPDYSGEFFKRLQEISADKGIDIASVMPNIPNASKSSKPELPRASKHGQIFDFVPDSSRDEPSHFHNDRGRSTFRDYDRGRNRDRSSSRSISQASSYSQSRSRSRSRSVDSQSSGSTIEIERTYNPDNLDAAINEMNSGPIPNRGDERTEMSIADLISEIDIYMDSLVSLGIDISSIPKPEPSMTLFEIRRIHARVVHLFNKETYTDFATDVLIIGATTLERIFDGSRYFLGKVPMNYTGLSNEYTRRLSQNRPGIKHAVSEVARKTGVSPLAIMAGKFIIPLVSVPIKNSRNDSVIRDPEMQKTMAGIR